MHPSGQEDAEPAGMHSITLKVWLDRVTRKGIYLYINIYIYIERYGRKGGSWILSDIFKICRATARRSGAHRQKIAPTAEIKGGPLVFSFSYSEEGGGREVGNKR